MTLEDMEKERTEIWTGPDEIISKSLGVLRSITSQYDLCLDTTGPKLILSQPQIRDAYFDLASRSIKIRVITEISKENLPETKELLKIAEVRHMDGMTGNFVIADKKEYACTPQPESDNSIARLMVSNVRHFVKQQQYFFELLWQKAIPAQEKIRHIEDGVPLQISEVAYGSENVIAKGLEILGNVKETLDLCGDANGPSAILAAPPIYQKYLELKSRGVQIRHIVEITPENIEQCKKMMKFSELRHLEGLKGYFAILDSKLFASNTADTPDSVLPHVIVSTVKPLVEQQKYSFDTLWNRALPAEQRLMQLEQGIEPERTEIWDGMEYVARRSNEVLASVKIGYDHCIDEKGPSIIASNEFIKQAYLGVVSRGGKIRLITSVNENNLAYCKQLISFIEIRHMDNIRGNFGIVDRKLYGGIAETFEGHAPSRYISSNVKHFVEQQQSFFDTLWERAIPIQDRIHQLEEGIEPQTTELIIGQEAQIKKIIQCYEDEGKEICTCSDASGVYFITSSAPILRVAEDFVKHKGGRMRFITEITPENIAQCKTLLKTSDIRHLDGVRNNFGVSSKHYLGFFVMHEKGIISHVVHSTSSRVIDEQKFLFNVLWEKSVPAIDRIKEIEEGIKPESTEIILGEDKIFQATLELGNRLKQSTDNCIDSNSAVSFSRHLEMWKHLVSLHERGIRIRIVTDINTFNIEDCKKLAQIATMKHLEGVQGNFGICDGSEYRASPEVIAGGPPKSLICSNVRVFVKQQQYFFDTLWDKALPSDLRFKELEEGVEPEVTKLIQSPEETIKLTLESMPKIKQRLDLCGSKDAPSVIVDSPLVFEAYKKLRERGIPVRYITEITSENLRYCRELSHYLDIRHLEDTKGNFGVSERDYIASAEVERSKPLSQAIYSSNKEFVNQQRYIFENLWHRAVPAAIRFRELEEGLEPERTELWQGADEIIKKTIQWYEKSSKRLDACIDSHGPSVILSAPPIVEALKVAVKRGMHVRIITEITSANIKHCKQLAEWFDLRHLDGIKGNFGVNDTSIQSNASHEQGTPPPVMMYSNVRGLVDQQKYFFDMLWNKSVPSQQRFAQLEQGVEPEFTEVIHGWDNVIKMLERNFSRATTTVDSVGESILPLIVVQNSLHLAALDFLKRGGKIRLLTEVTPENLSYVKQLIPYHEVRHLDGIRANFGVSDMDFTMPTAVGGSYGQPQMLITNSKQVIKHHQYLFNTLWEKGLPVDQRIQELEQGREPESTQIITGWENVQSTLERIFSRTREHVDSCSHQYDIPLMAKYGLYKPGIEFVKRGGKVRLVTEITNENLSHVKELLEWFEIRHLNGVRANFGVSESYFSAPTSMGDYPQIVVSNSGDAIRQHQYLFDTLWEKAITATDRIKELEEGAEPEITEVWRGAEYITARSLEILSKIKKSYDHCFDKNVASIIIGYAPFRDAGLRLQERGVKLRYVTEITSENISYCKELMKFAELRHLDSIQGNFGIADGIKYAAVANPRPGQPPTEQVHSTVKPFVKQQQYFFELLWNRAIPADQRIAEIEHGVRPRVVEVIAKTQESITRAFELMNAVKKDYCVFFATARTFLIAAKSPGISDVYGAMVKRGAKVRILVPRPFEEDKAIDSISNALTLYCKEMSEAASGVEIRISDANIESHISFLVADNNEVITWELKDDTLEDPYAAGGVAIYSNIEALAVSYSKIFENLWKVADLTGQLRATNLRLEQNQKAMSEFINIAAHELRTPIQPILGLAEVLRSSVRQNGETKNVSLKEEDERDGISGEFGNIRTLTKEQYHMLEVIIRNAQRLGMLSEEILDVARIDAGTMKLKKEKVDLHSLVQKVVNDFMLSAASSTSYTSGSRPLPYLQVSCTCDNEHDGSLVVRIDPGRIAQVISNLLANAWKFTTQTEIRGGIIEGKNEDKIDDKIDDSLSSKTERNNDYKHSDHSMISIRIEKIQETGNNGVFINTGNANSNRKIEGNNNGMIAVTVSDNGTGIDGEIMPRLFERFVTKSDKGTGLGLYISKGIIEAHGGKIWGKNNENGKGASFTFTIPADS